MRLSSSKLLNLLVVFLIPLINLGFTSIYIPSFMKVGEFADWRFASSLIAFAGILHLGIADGLYISWLARHDIRPNVSKHFIIFLASIIVFNALIVTIAVYLYNFLSLIGIFALFLVFLSTCVFSFSNYFALVFLEENQFRIAIASQSIAFFLCVVLARSLDILTAPVIIASYALSCIPLNFIMLKNVIISNNENGSSGEIYGILKSGFAILAANLLIILFINFDKLYARFYLENDVLYAKYSVSSSIFVASCGLGLSTGTYLISNKIYFFKYKYRLLLGVGIFCVSILVSPLVSRLLNLVIKSYTIDYTYFAVLSIFSLFTFSTYVSYCKFHLPKLCQRIFVLFPVVYCVAVTIGVLLLDLSFDHLSASVLIAFLILVILIVEVKGDFKLE